MSRVYINNAFTERRIFRSNDHARANAKTDPYALKAWCWQVLARANEDRPSADYERGAVTLDFLTKVARLSWSENGPHWRLDCRLIPLQLDAVSARPVAVAAGRPTRFVAREMDVDGVPVIHHGHGVAVRPVVVTIDPSG